MATSAMLGYGTLFAFESTTSPADSPLTYTPVAEVRNVNAPNQQTDDVDVTHNQSPNRTREFISGLIDPGEASFELNFVPGSASDIRIRGLLTAGTLVNCRITWPNSINWDFAAIVKGYEVSAATEDAISATVTMRVTGSVAAA